MSICSVFSCEQDDKSSDKYMWRQNNFCMQCILCIRYNQYNKIKIQKEMTHPTYGNIL